MRKATRADVAFAAKHGLSVAQLAEAIDDYKAAKGLTTRKPPSRATAEPHPNSGTPESPAGEARPPRWETRRGDDLELTPEEFVTKYYAAEKAKVTPRPLWDEAGPYGNRPAEFIAEAYAPEMAAGTLHRKMIANDTETGKDLVGKLSSWLRSHRMPKGVDIPTYPEWNTRQLAARTNAAAGREAERLAAVERMRPTKSDQKETPPGSGPRRRLPKFTNG